MDVYESVTSKRANLNLLTRKLIFNAIIHVINGMSASQILSLSPLCKAVIDLKRIVQRTKKLPT